MHPALFRCSRNLALFLTFIALIWDTLGAEPLAGWAEIEITPPLGIALGGRGGNYTLAQEILDPLYAQVCYLKDAQGVGFVLVSFDLVSLPHDLSDKIRFSLVHELGVPWNLVLLNCSHTHSGPNMLRNILAGVGPAPAIETTYFNSLHEKIVTAARTIAKNMKPTSAAVFEGTSQVAINRRGKNKSGGISILPNPSGPIDEKLWVMKLTPLDGTAPAVIFSYACHPVIVYGYKGAAISADFPGAARQSLREHLGEKTHLQFVQGLGGNVRPRAVADLEKMNFRRGSPAALQQCGTDLANDVLATLKKKGRVLNLNIAAATDRPFLPRGNPPPRATYEKMAEDKSAYAQSVANYWLKRYDTGEGFAHGDAWSVGLIRLADNQWIVHFAGEPVVEWRQKIARWLPGKKFVPFGYSQEAHTYLPTEELLPEGGYEVLECNRARLNSPAPFAPGLHAAIRQSLLQQAAFIAAHPQ